MNLKTAARRLGVHYQTAYRWVRSGELVAVKVGSGYEISEAAMARFQAQRAAVERVPDIESHPAAGDDRPGGIELLDAMVDQVVVDASAVEQHAARVVATTLGDTAVVRVDGNVSFEHADPQRAVLLGALVHRGWRRDRIADRAEREGVVIFMPQVPQRELRYLIHDEFHQYLGSFGLFSAVAAPVVVSHKPRGSLLAGRDEPGRPYTNEDRDYVVEVAARLSVANERAERAREAWATRARLLEDLASRSEAALVDWLASAAGEEEAVALADPDTNILGATRSFVDLLGAQDADLGAIPDHVDNEDDVRVICDRVVDGEIDYFSIASGCGPSNIRVMFHGGVVRTPDATPRCIVVAAHAVPEVGAT